MMLILMYFNYLDEHASSGISRQACLVQQLDFQNGNFLRMRIVIDDTDIVL